MRTDAATADSQLIRSMTSLAGILTFVFGLSPVHGGVMEWEVHMQQGLTQYQHGDYPNAAASITAALKEAEAFGEGDPRLPLTLNILGTQYLSLGEYAEAEPLLKRSLAIRKRIFGSGHPDVSTSLNNLAMLYGSQGKYGEAEPLLKQAVESWEKALGPESPDVAMSLNNLAMIYSAQGKYALAELLLKRSVGIWEKVLDAKNLATTLENISKLYTKMGRSTEAQQFAHQATRTRAVGNDKHDQSRYVDRSLPR